MADACIKSANSYRSKHQKTPSIAWDVTLASKAQAYAQHLLDQTLQSGRACLQHDPANKQEPKIGENLFYAEVNKSENEDLANFAEKANISWYSEIKDWDFNTSDRKATGATGATGHFTQLVWVNTTKVGYGFACAQSPSNPGNKVVFVCAKFQPAGNFHMAGKRDEAYKSNVQLLRDPSTLTEYTKGAAKPAPVKSSTSGGYSSSKSGGSSSSTSISTSVVNGVKVTTKTRKALKGGDEIIEVFENDVLKKKTVNGKDQQW